MNDAKKKVFDQKVKTEKDVKNSPIMDGSILPPSNTEHLLDVDSVATNSKGGKGAVLTYEAPSGNVFIVGDKLKVVMGDKAPITLCSRLEVVSEGCDKHGRGRCRLVRFTDTFGNSRERVIMLSDLVTNQGKVLASLVDEGLTLYRANAQGGNNQVAEFINTYPVEKFFTTVDAYGWVELGKSFIVPSATVGDTNGSEIVFNGDEEGAPKYAQAGTLEQWQNTIGLNAKHSSRIAFAVCMAFASPLLKFTSEPSGGFHLVGQSSSGKTTAIRAGVSVWAQVLEDSGELKNSWNATGNGLEGVAKNHSDLPLFLDELGQGDNGRVNVEQVLYMLGNGSGKRRMTREAKARASNEWRLLFMSAGELSASEMMERQKKDIQTGANVRMATIEACPEGGHGVFETLPKGVEARALAESSSENGAKYYGTAGVDFMRAVIDDIHQRGGVEAMKAHITEKMKEWVEAHAKNCNPQIQRVAKRFALVAVAGELATEYDVLPWNTGDASQFASLCFKSFVDGFETTDDRKLRLCRELIDYVVAYPNFFQYITPPNLTLYPALNNPICGSVIYGATSSDSVRGEPAIVIFTQKGMKTACGDKEAETKKALKDLGWMKTNNGKKMIYKPKGNTSEIQVGGISLPTGYVVIIPKAFPDNVQVFVENSVFDSK